jgi:ribonuclease G
MVLTEEILVNVNPLETRVAVIEQGLLQELYIERASQRSIVGNIYLGKVVRVMPGMQAAFIDFGEQRTGFLHANDIASSRSLSVASKRQHVADITEVIRQGQTVLVQVSKEPLGEKGARLTTRLSLSSRYLVYMPGSGNRGVSQKITDASERERLLNILRGALAGAGADVGSELPELDGLIVRTAADGAEESQLTADVLFLSRLWQDVSRRAQASTAPQRVHVDLSLLQRTARDISRASVERILIDEQCAHEQLADFCRNYVPQLDGRVEYYAGNKSVFELHGVEDEVERALGRRIDLKSGGHLIIDQTEAMTTIDVNTGTYIGHSKQEDTIVHTNLEAISALTRQLRLRNLGGIIIIDFIDMSEQGHRQQVVRELEKALARDHAHTAVTTVSELGLVEMTRQRERESIGHLLCDPCPHCEGRGEVKSVESVCCEIFRKIMSQHRQVSEATLVIQAQEDVVDRLQGQEASIFADLGDFIGKTIQFRVESMYSREQYDIIRL